jgi:hypothetical protein
MIATEPRAELGQMFDDAGGSREAAHRPDRVVIRPDQQVAVRRDQFRWFTGGWRVNAELPDPE